MKTIYTSPLRVYLLLGLLAITGVWAGMRLPISLFPQGNRPVITVSIPTGDSTPEEFLQAYGSRLEADIYRLQNRRAKVEKVTARYSSSHGNYDVEFPWGTQPEDAVTELRSIVTAAAAQLPKESRDGINVWENRNSGGFFASSFYSDRRSVDELYKILEPVITPRVSKIPDAEFTVLWNPNSKEITVELIPEALAAFQLTPMQIEQSLQPFLSSYSGGSLQQGTSNYRIQIPGAVKDPEQMGRLVLTNPSGQAFHLSSIARVMVAPSGSGNQIFKTDGSKSLILFASPKSGGNIKKMAEDIKAAVETGMPLLPEDIQHRVLVDPSLFIRDAIQNVLREVLLAAAIAVAILFLFIGSIRNVITAAIEIPLSMVLAFILMKLFGMNLNLISLAGLALSAGMNVDASVVVMENIFRHFDQVKGTLSASERVEILTRAVREVWLPVVASTLSSLIVFIPLTFTSDLTYAILGDLAKAVVFSHGFSAIVALILVPTIRLQIMKSGGDKETKPILENQLKKLESLYERALRFFLEHRPLKWMSLGSLLLALILLASFALPTLPREIIGRPDTDWIVLSINPKDYTLIQETEQAADAYERDLRENFGKQVNYTFTQVMSPKDAVILARLNDRKEMEEVWKAMEKHFKNSPFVEFHVSPWNPSQLPIPDPPDLKIAVRGNDGDAMRAAAEKIRNLLEEKKIFPRIYTDPSSERRRGLVLKPHLEQWAELAKTNSGFSPALLSDVLRVATEGRRLGELTLQDTTYPIFLRFPDDTIDSVGLLESFPLGLMGKLIPLKALAEVTLEPIPSDLLRVDQKRVFQIQATEDREKKSIATQSESAAKDLLLPWVEEQRKLDPTFPTVEFEDPKIELTQALSQLSYAVSCSIGLILVTLILQFGSFLPPLVVLVAIPLGLIGVIASLAIFGSTLSLNSALGVILLNGIAVSNSIILVDFILRLAKEGLSAKEAAIQAGKVRLRPILVTSLTTIFGMLPMALGMGEGGKILQPLGITVSGGLWVSTLLTLFVVPALQVSVLEWQKAGAPTGLRRRHLFKSKSQRSLEELPV